MKRVLCVMEGTNAPQNSADIDDENDLPEDDCEIIKSNSQFLQTINMQFLQEHKSYPDSLELLAELTVIKQQVNNSTYQVSQ